MLLNFKVVVDYIVEALVNHYAMMKKMSFQQSLYSVVWEHQELGFVAVDSNDVFDCFILKYL